MNPLGFLAFWLDIFTDPPELRKRYRYDAEWNSIVETAIDQHQIQFVWSGIAEYVCIGDFSLRRDSSCCLGAPHGYHNENYGSAAPDFPEIRPSRWTQYRLLRFIQKKQKRNHQKQATSNRDRFLEDFKQRNPGYAISSALDED